MSQRVHLVYCGVKAYEHAESRSLLPNSFCDQKFPSHINFGLQRSFSLSTSIICGASSSNPRRNGDYSRASRGYSRNRHWHNEDRDSNDESLDETDLLTAKNGPLFSFSTAAKSHTTADPGPREKEIVELFRKVQAKLREKAAVTKEEKYGESFKSKDEVKEKTVESLLKLLRKHSTEESGGNNVSLRSDTVATENKNRAKASKEKHSSQPTKPSTTRPASVFRRKSPIPQAKVLFYGNDDEEKVPEDGNSDEESEVEEEIESELEMEMSTDASLVEEDGYDELLENDNIVHDVAMKECKHEELLLLKMPELRSLAKSRGIKGYSKMKKTMIVDLLVGN